METEKEGNKMVLEKVIFHLLQAARLCSQLDLSRLGALEQREWEDRIKICKNALEFTKDSVEKLSILIG
jgi:hypothetical protein